MTARNGSHQTMSTRPRRIALRFKTAKLRPGATAGSDAFCQPRPSIFANPRLHQALPYRDRPQGLFQGEPRKVIPKPQVIVACINCRSPIKLGFQPIDGQILFCVACGAELEVVNDQPLELTLYSEDWDDDDGELF